MSKDWPKDIYNMHTHYDLHKVVRNMDSEKLRKFLEFRIKFLQEELDEMRNATNAEDVVEIIYQMMHEDAPSIYPAI